MADFESVFSASSDLDDDQDGVLKSNEETSAACSPDEISTSSNEDSDDLVASFFHENTSMETRKKIEEIALDGGFVGFDDFGKITCCFCEVDEKLHREKGPAWIVLHPNGRRKLFVFASHGRFFNRGGFSVILFDEFGEMICRTGLDHPF